MQDFSIFLSALHWAINSFSCLLSFSAASNKLDKCAKSPAFWGGGGGSKIGKFMKQKSPNQRKIWKFMKQKKTQNQHKRDKNNKQRRGGQFEYLWNEKATPPPHPRKLSPQAFQCAQRCCLCSPYAPRLLPSSPPSCLGKRIVLIGYYSSLLLDDNK